MSNKQVVSGPPCARRVEWDEAHPLNPSQPAVYRTIINDVIENVRAEFDEVGVEEAVLQELLRSWETKVAQSRVADFSSDPRMGPVARQFPMLPSVPASAAVSPRRPVAA
jgi:hypothetical protein